MTEKRLKTNQKKTREQEKEMRKIRFRTLFKNVQTFAIVFPRCRCFDKIVLNYQAETAKVQ